MKVVIIAGGKGTRIASVNSEIPKAMIPVGGKPVIEHQVMMAKRYGFHEFIFLIGHLGEQIIDYFGKGERWNVNITYHQESSPLGTAGALSEVADQLSEDFFVFYGDTVMDIDMPRMLRYHQERHADATLLVHPNDHPFDSDLVETDQKSKITDFHFKPHSADLVSKNLVNAALFIFNRKVVPLIARGRKSHIEKDLLPLCLDSGMNLYGYRSTEYVKDMGTPERYQQVCADWTSGRVSAMNAEKKKKAVFLDRDGVINKDNGLIYNPSQIELVEGIEDAINYIHSKGYLAIVVTNQSVIARNLCTFEELDTINATLETFLGKRHAYIDGMFICPHHPDSGYPEERKEYKIKCSCRKPEPGLLLQAAQEMNIDLKESIMAGDRESDVQAGVNAGVRKSILIPSNKPEALLKSMQSIL